jgi:outer membrane protein assembly factor BamB
MKRLLTMSLLACTLCAPQALAADAPQFRGPTRDGIFKDTGLMKSWPEGGPPLAWKKEGIGKGYAAAAVVGDTIYVPGMQDDKQGYLYALDLSGAEKWKAAYGPETEDSQAPGARATPSVDGDRVYVLSGLGGLTCLATADGKQLWQVDMMKEFGGQTIMWAIAESQLVDGDRVYVTPGGTEATVVALDKMTGKTVWTCYVDGERSAYCSPTIFTFGGRRVLVTMTSKSVIGIDEATGKLLWKHPHPTNFDIHAVTPVSAGNVIYYTAGYGSGGGALDVSPDGSSVTQKWLDSNLDCQHHGVVLLDGYIYGTGQNNNKLFCLELATGKVMWSTDEVTQGDIAYADGMLYVYQGPRKGVVSLVKASPEKFEAAGSFVVPKDRDKHWANPAIANGRLYIRYAGNLYAYDIAAK